MAEQVASIINNNVGGGTHDPINVFPLHKVAASILISYSNAGHHVGFHYDTYATANGKMNNAIVPVEASSNSCCTFQYVPATNTTTSGAALAADCADSLETIRLEDHPSGTTVVFEGSTVFHGVTDQCEGERIVVWSTMFVVDGYTSSVWAGYLNIIFDLAYNGFR
jgi:hypothetical protein